MANKNKNYWLDIEIVQLYFAYNISGILERLFYYMPVSRASKAGIVFIGVCLCIGCCLKLIVVFKNLSYRPEIDFYLKQMSYNKT